jgi:hypothetical protein
VDSAEATGIKWAAASGGSGGGWSLISTNTISDSPATVQISLTGSYRHYILEFDGVYGSNGGSVLRFKTSANGGATFDGGASDYAWASGQVTGYSPTNTLAATYVDIWGSLGSTIDGKFYGKLIITNAKDAAVLTVGEWSLHGRFSAGIYVVVAGCFRRNANQVTDAIQFYTTPGGFTAGTIRLYGSNDQT